MAKKTMKFEESLERLEEVLRLLEEGDASLDESLKLYEEGVALVRVCSDQLEHAEQKVKMLQMQADGTPALVDFSEQE